MSSVLLVSVLITATDLASRVFKTMGITAGSVYGTVATGALLVGGAIVAATGAAIDLSAQFDQSMHKVAGLTTLIQSSGEDMQYWENQILALAPQIDVAPTQLANALYFVASAGIPASQVMSVLKYSAMAAAATMGDMSKVADLVTSAMNAYKNQGMDAATATNVIVDAVKNGKVEMQALETSFSFVAISGLSAKFSLQEVAAAVSTLTQVSGNTAARRVQMDLDNLIRRLGDTGGIAKSAQSLGIAFNEGQFAGEGLIQKLQTLMQMSGFTTDTLNQMWIASGKNEQKYEAMALAAANASTAFKKLAGGAAAMIPSVILMNDKGATFNQIYAQMMSKADAVTAAFNTMRQSTGQKWNQFIVTLESIAIQLGLHILPAVNQVIDAFRVTGARFITWVQMPGHFEQIKYALIGIAIVVTAVLIPAVIHLLIAAAPITLAILAIVAAGIALGFIIRLVVEHFGGWHAVMVKLQPVIMFLQQTFAEAGKELKQAFANPQMQAALKQLQQDLPKLIPVLKILAVIVGGALYFAFEGAIKVLVLVGYLLPVVITILDGLVQALGLVGQALLWAFNGAHWEALLKSVGDTLGKFFGWLGASAKQWGSNLLQGFIDGIKSKLNDLKNALGGAATAVKNFLGFHSPTKEGAGHDADTWAPNLIRMYASGIDASLPLLSAAASRAASTLSLGLLAMNGQAATAGSAALGPTIASVSSLSSTTINAHFPNATDSGQIQAAFKGLMAQQQRQQYHLARRPGYGGGLRAGI